MAVMKEKVRLAVIGTGSRGQFHLHNMLDIPNVEVVALCDNYLPHLQEASVLFPKAKILTDYRQVLELKDVSGVLIAHHYMNILG